MIRDPPQPWGSSLGPCVVTRRFRGSSGHEEGPLLGSGGIAPAPVRYDLRTRHCGVMGGSNGYIYSAAEVLPELLRFVAENS